MQVLAQEATKSGTPGKCRLERRVLNASVLLQRADLDMVLLTPVVFCEYKAESL